MADGARYTDLISLGDIDAAIRVAVFWDKADHHVRLDQLDRLL